MAAGAFSCWRHKVTFDSYQDLRSHSFVLDELELLGAWEGGELRVLCGTCPRFFRTAQAAGTHHTLSHERAGRRVEAKPGAGAPASTGAVSTDLGDAEAGSGASGEAAAAAPIRSGDPVSAAEQSSEQEPSRADGARAAMAAPGSDASDADLRRRYAALLITKAEADGADPAMFDRIERALGMEVLERGD